jgi:hypothetical protein
MEQGRVSDGTAKALKNKKSMVTIAVNSLSILALLTCPKATFAATCQLTVIAGTGGTITAPATQTVTVNQDSQTIITAHPNAGYAFAEWVDTSTSAIIVYKNSASTKIKLPPGNATIQASFIKITSALTPITISTFQKEPGANYSYYKGTWTALPNFAALTTDSAGPCDSLDVKAIPHQANHFGAVFNGYLDIPFDGKYVFYLKSSDGSALLLNDSVIISNDGVHATSKEDSTTVNLLSGTYLIGVLYFNSNSSPVLSVSYSCPEIGIEKATIPNGALSRPFTGPVPKIIVTKPAGGETYHLGDTLHVQWIYKNPRGQTFASLSHNNAKSFDNISALAFPGNVTTYDWTIPIDSISYITQSAFIRVEEYPPYDKNGVSNAFSIAPPAAIKNLILPGRKAAVTVKISRTELMLKGEKNKTIDNAVLINVNGAIIAKGQKTAPDQQHFAISSVPVGMYILSWHSSEMTLVRFITITR